MTSTPGEPADASLGNIGPRVARNNRIGRILIMVGIVALVNVIVWGFLINPSGASGLRGFAIEVTGSGALAVIMAGSVLFGESRSFMRKHKGVL